LNLAIVLLKFKLERVAKSSMTISTIADMGMLHFSLHLNG
jgi:hypothetical protein